MLLVQMNLMNLCQGKQRARTHLFELTFQRKEGQILRRLKNKRSGELFASCVKKHIFLAFFRACSALYFVSNVLKPFLPHVDWINDFFSCIIERKRTRTVQEGSTKQPSSRVTMQIAQ